MENGRIEDMTGGRERTLRVGVMAMPTFHGIPLKMDDPYDKDQVERYLTLMESAMDEGLDVLVAPEYAFVPGRPLSRDEKDGLVGRLAGLTKGRDVLLVPGTYAWVDDDYLHNTLPLLHDGELVHSYDKKEDGGDGHIAERYGRAFAPGDKSGVVAYKDLDLGLELCADHRAGALYAEAGDNALDLQFVVSCGMGLMGDRMAVHEGGYAVLCDGQLGSAAVMRRTYDGGGYRLDRLEPVTTDGALNVYELTFNGPS